LLKLSTLITHSSQGNDNLKIEAIGQGLGLGKRGHCDLSWRHFVWCVLCSTVNNEFSVWYDVLLYQTAAQIKILVKCI